MKHSKSVDIPSTIPVLVPAPSVLPPLIQAEITSDETHTLVTSLLDQLEHFGSVLNDLLLKITFAKTAAQNSTTLVDEAFDKGELNLELM